MRGEARARAVQCGLLSAGLVLVAAMGASGQSPSESVTPPTQPRAVPLTGMQTQSGDVSVTQRTTNSGGGNTVNAINSSVDVRAPLNGSTPSGKATTDVIPLTLAQAVSMGLRYNVGAIQRSNEVLQAQGQRAVAKSMLMPNLSTAISEVFERENIRTLGVKTPSFPESSTFNYYDARAVRLQQSVFDLVRIDNLHSASETLKANITAARNTRDLVVLAVGGTYLQLISTQARVQAAQAQVESAKAIAKQASDRFAAGLAARVDAERAQVQLQTEQQRLRALQADRDTQKLRLARLIGLPLGQQFSTVEEYKFAPLAEVTLETALQRAYQGRSDMQAAATSVRAAEEALKAAHAERVPSLNVNADFGAAGITPTHESTGVYMVSGTLTIPLYEGGRIHGDIQEADAAVRQRKAELEDVRGQVDEDVRQAFIDLDSAADQVNVAQSNVSLAHDALQQSTDRFAAGVADTVELVQAEQAVVQADDDYITAVYEHNLAKVALARAMGNAEQTLPQMLRK